ncbi:MAG TPA: HAMP domain-containing sensor histidine kinase [Alphaproteobacteria bacterium]|nr:HAMP domain-containing sensor histidine kinase [Alphaproteobacteria bacterium]
MNRPPKLPRGLYGLSARLLILTIIFVMISEVLIYAPSIARFRRDYLEGRIAAAHLATLALEATPDNMVSEELKAELLDHAGAIAIVIAKPGEVRRVLSSEMPPNADAVYDLRAATFVGLLADAFMALFETDDRVLRIVGRSPKQAGVTVEVLLHEWPMRMAMIDFSWRILALSLLISLFTAGAVYGSLQWLMVRPMRRLTENIMAFRNAPEDLRNVIATSDRADEIGIVTRELAGMEDAVRTALSQKARLAALGSAITKINHDLRNILATARLVSDRLADSTDPKVQRLAPTLVGSIDRAVTLCEQTLDYARDELPRPRRERFIFGELIEEVGRVVALLTKDSGGWQMTIPDGLVVDADRDQLFRVFVNLGRNAVEAGARQVRVDASIGGTSDLIVEVGDNGPGIVEKAQEKLFQPFAGSARAGGTGLGLVIARELIRAHGGELSLARTDSSGTVFRILIPGAAVVSSRAAE